MEKPCLVVDLFFGVGTVSRSHSIDVETIQRDSNMARTKRAHERVAKRVRDNVGTCMNTRDGDARAIHVADLMVNNFGSARSAL